MDQYKLNVFEEEVDTTPIYSKDTIGHKEVKYPINVFTEFGDIKAIIMGYTSHSAQIPNDANMLQESPEVIACPYPKDLIERAQQIQNDIAKKLMDHGIQVVRPNEIDHSVKLQFQGIELSSGFQTFNARDLLLYYHDSVYDSPTSCESRLFESEAYDWIISQQRTLGGKWYKSWKSVRDPEAPFWEAANMSRLGLDLLYQISMSGNESGYRVFRKHMEDRYKGKVRVHAVKDVYDGIHLDTTFCPLGFNKNVQKYIVLVNTKYVTPTNIPAIFRGDNWVVLECPKMVETEHYPGISLASCDIGQNLFILNPHLVLCEEWQIPLINTLKYYGIETINFPNEPGRALAGGMHCMTNDYHREENMDFNKILTSSDESLLPQDLAGYFDLDLLTFLQRRGDLDDWVNICNENKRYPKYLTDHLTVEQKDEMEKRHHQQIYG